MKKGISILLLVVFLAHFAGFYVYYIIQLKQIRTEMKAQLKKLPDHRLELIILSASDFEKARIDDHEIKIHGKLYDIARVHQVENNYFVYCLYDEAEGNLIAFLDKLVTTPLKDKNVPVQVFKFTSLTFIVSHCQTSFQSTFTEISKHTEYAKSISSVDLTLDTPPPQG